MNVLRIPTKRAVQRVSHNAARATGAMILSQNWATPSAKPK
jgi:hypothetical protein